MLIPANPIFERVVRASAAEIGHCCGFPPDRIEDLKLVVSEAVNNAIEHGSCHVLEASVAVVFQLDDDKLDIIIRDCGGAVGRIDLSQRVVEEQNLANGMLRGFGMHLITSLVDDYTITASQTGISLTLRLYRKRTSL